MIDNDYIYELDIDFDIRYLLNLITKYKQDTTLLKHQRLVANDQYLTGIKNKFQILSPIWNFYDFEPNRVLNCHIDSERSCALNIPLTGTLQSSTIFYNLPKLANLDYDDTRKLNWVNGCTDNDKIFEFTLSRPTLIKNSIPHSVKNGPSRRIILSWSITKDISFEEAKDFFKNGI
jgi:hypothetical protein